ncbi:arabinose efflux permease family protein [Metallosphaera yellowstonensis MK1]|uniref:Arabinose efflux permease family protein n=1 Tax=Metallosphaera yellowstonensis MK1 TaxID=671065 RepID=H2C422_9CREN|nr:MFS transporter [Metallosphaera yellowstonensis]EHP70917.1 arabinose efflux permease family protein [Metallosphaera yellowstonensis MK1]
MIKKTFVVALSLGNFSDGYDLLIVSGVLGQIAKVLSLSNLQIGVLVSSAFVGSVIGALVMGVLSDYVGRRLSFIISGVLFVLGSMLSIWSSYALLLIGRIIVGFAIGGEIPTSATLIAELMGSNRAKIMSLSFTSWAMGGITALLVSIPLSALGYRSVLLTGAFPSIFLLILNRSMPESPLWLRKQRSFKRINWRVLPLILQQFLLTMALASLAAYVPSYLHITTESSGVVLWASFGTGSLLALLTLDKLGRKPVTCLGCGSAALALVAYHVIPFTLFLVWLWLSGGLVFSSTFTALAELTETSIRGRGHGLGFFSGRLGGALGTFVFPLMLYHVDAFFSTLGVLLGIISTVTSVYLMETRGTQIR